ncbi:MAG: 3-methylornithine--L-lysine ligase PylC [Clostridiales Family XIII bacterium]|jgi:pyrrolysine biosynthesis protein PylC|nr:3-methylornithine--L-lysine ligase PylC [Clostridiales Family XIII bacterium]
MMTVALVGGRLQGIEAAFLAGEAGYHRILIDKTAATPASGLCEEIHVLDVAECLTNAAAARAVKAVMARADIVIPTLENTEALAALEKLSAECGVPLAFDFDAYRITSSKLRSDRLIRELGVPAPVYDPAAGPCVVKPSEGSGSEGVRVFETPAEAAGYLGAFPAAERENMIVQEYLEGPSYSVEVIGCPGRYRTYAITEIHVDESHDCNRVTTPCDVPARAEAAFRADAVRLAEALRLRGIMDVEAILSGGRMKVLEIDARLPSQTPAAIFASTGINMLSELVTLFTGTGERWLGNNGINAAEQENSQPLPAKNPAQFAAYENIAVSKGGAVSLGEHIMSGEKPLRLYRDFCHADFALTACRPGVSEYGGIFINRADTPELLETKRALMYNELAAQS